MTISFRIKHSLLVSVKILLAIVLIFFPDFDIHGWVYNLMTCLLNLTFIWRKPIIGT